MDVPPVMFTLVFLGAGDDVREALREEDVLFDLRSEISVPAAEGGSLSMGACMTSDLLSVDALFVDEEGGGRFVM